MVVLGFMGGWLFFLSASHLGLWTADIRICSAGDEFEGCVVSRV